MSKIYNIVPFFMSARYGGAEIALLAGLKIYAQKF